MAGEAPDRAPIQPPPLDVDEHGDAIRPQAEAQKDIPKEAPKVVTGNNTGEADKSAHDASAALMKDTFGVMDQMNELSMVHSRVDLFASFIKQLARNTGADANSKVIQNIIANKAGIAMKEHLYDHSDEYSDPDKPDALYYAVRDSDMFQSKQKFDQVIKDIIGSAEAEAGDGYRIQADDFSLGSIKNIIGDMRKAEQDEQRAIDQKYQIDQSPVSVNQTSTVETIVPSEKK